MDEQRKKQLQQLFVEALQEAKDEQDQGIGASDPQQNYEEFKERFKNMSDEQLIETYNSDRGKPGWVTSRAMFHTALREELEKRNILI